MRQHLRANRMIVLVTFVSITRKTKPNKEKPNEKQKKKLKRVQILMKTQMEILYAVIYYLPLTACTNDS